MSKPKFEKRHFDAMADYIRQTAIEMEKKGQNSPEAMNFLRGMRVLGLAMGQTNPNFNELRFIKACDLPFSDSSELEMMMNDDAKVIMGEPVHNPMVGTTVVLTEKDL